MRANINNNFVAKSVNEYYGEFHNDEPIPWSVAYQAFRKVGIMD